MQSYTLYSVVFGCRVLNPKRLSSYSFQQHPSWEETLCRKFDTLQKRANLTMRRVIVEERVPSCSERTAKLQVSELICKCFLQIAQNNSCTRKSKHLQIRIKSHFFAIKKFCIFLTLMHILSESPTKNNPEITSVFTFPLSFYCS